VIRDKILASILPGTFLVLISFAQMASSQTYYVPGAPASTTPYYAPRYASQVALPSRGAYFFDGCTPCWPDQIISCEPDASGWTAAPSAGTPTPDASVNGQGAIRSNPYGRFPESQNMEPIQNGGKTSSPSRTELVLSDDHPLLRPFHGTHGPTVATYASTNPDRTSSGAIASSNQGRDVSRPVDATVVTNSTQERPAVAWVGALPHWMREQPSRSPNTNSPTHNAGPSRSASEVLEQYGGVSRFDEPVLRR
jgi:hypothetical protein